MSEKRAGLTVEDLMSLREVTDAQVSSDGSIRACVVAGEPPRRGEPHCSEIWVAKGDDPTRPWVTGPAMHLMPRISPTGELLAFASDRQEAGTHRLYVASLDSPAAADLRLYDTVPGLVEEITWGRDESSLLVRTVEQHSEAGSVRQYRRHVPDDEKSAAVVVRRPFYAWRRLYRVDLVSGAAQQVSPDHLTVWEAGWDGGVQVAAVVSTVPQEDGWYAPELMLFDIESMSTRVIYRTEWMLQCPVISPDGRLVAVLEALQSDRGFLAGQIVIIDLETGAAVSPPHDADVTRLQWTSDGRLFWAGPSSVESACGFMVPDEDLEQVWRPELIWRGRATLERSYRVSASCSSDGSTVVASYQAHNTPEEFRELRPAERSGWRSLTNLNTALGGRVRATETLHRWAAEDDIEIEGLLLVPDGPTAASGLPLVVVVHGGPTNVTTSLFDSGAHRGDALLLVQAGCAVLFPNPRGSTGRGLEFMAANLGDLGGGDLRDIEAGVDSLVRSGTVDPRRVGIAGISYGGYMSAWAAVRSNRFVASIPISGMMNWLSFHNTSILGLFGKIFLGGDPYDLAGPYLDRSPIMYVNGCRTKTLIMHGDLDAACPLSQAQEFYNGLAETGCETELVVHQGAGHGVTERDHMIDMNIRILEWFTRHLELTAPVP